MLKFRKINFSLRNQKLFSKYDYKSMFGPKTLHLGSETLTLVLGSLAVDSSLEAETKSTGYIEAKLESKKVEPKTSMLGPSSIKLGSGH